VYLAFSQTQSIGKQQINKTNSGAQSASELYRPSYRRLSARLVPTLAERGCRVVSVTNPHDRKTSRNNKLIIIHFSGLVLCNMSTVTDTAYLKEVRIHIVVFPS
jgi:hypothetical protein